MIISIDFDRTIADTDNPPKGHKIGPPFPGAKEAINTFVEAGHKIIIHSCRANDGPRSIKVMADYLEYFKVPYHYIWDQIGKPVCDWYIDEKGIEFKNNWDAISRRILDVQ